MPSKFEVIMTSIKESPKVVSILPKQDARLLVIEKQYSINVESTLGAIVYNTGGIVIDGWIHIYGQRQRVLKKDIENLFLWRK